MQSFTQHAKRKYCKVILSRSQMQFEFLRKFFLAGKKSGQLQEVLELESRPTEKCQETLLGEEDKMLGSH